MAAAMGHIHQKVRLRADRAATVRMLVDTGATYSVIPRDLARRLGIGRPRRSVSMRLADGRGARFGVATAFVKIDDREGPTIVLVGSVAEPILGVETLEQLGLTVDSRRGRLTTTRPYTARL